MCHIVRYPFVAYIMGQNIGTNELTILTVIKIKTNIQYVGKEKTTTKHAIN